MVCVCLCVVCYKSLSQISSFILCPILSTSRGCILYAFHPFIHLYIYICMSIFNFFLSIYLCLSEKNYNIFTKSYVLNPNSLDGKGKTCYILTIINKLEYFIVCVWFCVSRIIFQMFGFLVFVGKIEINKI